MLKKSLIMASVLVFASTAMCYANENQKPIESAAPAVEAPAVPHCKKPPMNPEFKKRQEAFEKRLKLTDEQKAKAEQIRQKGHEQMKPIFEKIKEKRQEMDAVKRSRMAVQMQQERLAELQKEIKALKRAAHELRMQNMKEFEAILTKKQLKELKKMKEEGRKKFEKMHKKGGHPHFGEPRPEFGPEGPGPRPEHPAPCPEGVEPPAPSAK